MRKLLFFDIDGTILSEGKKRYIPDSAVEAIHKLQQNGHLCFINSGRSWSEINDNIIDLGFDGFVCGCGTFINYHGKPLLADELPMELADAIYADLHSYKLEWLLEGQHAIYYSTLPYRTHIGDFYKEYHTLSRITAWIIHLRHGDCILTNSVSVSHLKVICPVLWTSTKTDLPSSTAETVFMKLSLSVIPRQPAFSF